MDANMMDIKWKNGTYKLILEKNMYTSHVYRLRQHSVNATARVIAL